jgi:hypothetical protein
MDPDADPEKQNDGAGDHEAAKVIRFHMIPIALPSGNHWPHADNRIAHGAWRNGRNQYLIHG